MPLERVGTGWRFGKNGKVYYGKGARAKAAAQGRAIEVTKHGTPKRKKKTK